MLPNDLIPLLDDWVALGWLRPLDRAFVVFLKEQQPDSPDLALLGAALASHQLGRGHVCLELQEALAKPDETLSLPPEGELDTPPADKPSALLAGITIDTWEQCLQNSALVTEGDGNTPLVLSDGRLYLRRYWNYTQQVARQILDRVKRKQSVPSGMPQRLDDLFASLRNPAEKNKKEIHWQSIAAAIAAASAFSVISGGPGTGKTTTVVHLLHLLQELAMSEKSKMRIRLAAPTGKAAARLTESMGHAVDQLPDPIKKALPDEVTTLHRLLGSRPGTRHFLHTAQNPLHVDLLVVDEASMIDLEMMAALMEALPANARLILLGDKDQLASVEAGSVLGDLCRNADPSSYNAKTVKWIKTHTGYHLPSTERTGSALDQHIVVLKKSHRFDEKSGIGALARAVNAGVPEQVEAVWRHGYRDIAQVIAQSTEERSFAQLILDGRGSKPGKPSSKAVPAGYRTYLESIKAGPGPDTPEEEWLRTILRDFNLFQLLSPLRKGNWGVEKLNTRTAAVLFNTGLINATSGWYVGRPVMVTRNDYSLGLMNGDTGIALPVGEAHNSKQKRLKVVFPMPNGVLKKVLPSRLKDVETVYAMTVHKSQGSEFDHTVLAFPDTMSPALTRELIYTAITRSRTWFTLLSPSPHLMTEAVKRRVHRASGLGECLDQIQG